MFPRRDGIVLAGTHVRGDWTLEPDLLAKSRILAGRARCLADCEQSLNEAYNVSMLRAALSALLVASILTVALQAQLSAPTFQGHAGPHSHSGFLGQRSLSNGFSPQRSLPNGASPNRFHRHHDRHDGVLSLYFVPDYDPFWYAQSDAEEATAPPVLIEQRDDEQLRMREKPLPKSQIIDIPGAPSSKIAKTLPPTIFILIDGERLESRQFLLTATDLSLNVNRYYRNIPLQMLNLDAIRHRIAASIACHAAIKVNMPLEQNKMEWLLRELAQTECPMSCPHGRPVVLRYSVKDIQKAFKRI